MKLTRLFKRLFYDGTGATLTPEFSRSARPAAPSSLQRSYRSSVWRRANEEKQTHIWDSFIFSFFRVSSFDLHLDPNAIWARPVAECLSVKRMLEQSKNTALLWRRLPRAHESEGCTCSLFDGGTFSARSEGNRDVNPPGWNARRHMLLSDTRGHSVSRWPALTLTLMLTLALATATETSQSVTL